LLANSNKALPICLCFIFKGAVGGGQDYARMLVLQSISPADRPEGEKIAPGHLEQGEPRLEA